jgi:hypothetical protein
MSKFTEKVINDLTTFPFRSLEKFESSVITATKDNPITLDLNLVLEISNLDEYNRAFAEAEKYYGF